MSDTANRKGRFDWLTLWSAVFSVFLASRLVFVSMFANSDGVWESPTASDIRQYWFAAGLLIALQVALLVRAIMQRRGVLVFLSSMAVLVALAFSLMVSVPQIDWKPDPPAYTTNPDYVPCYSGSGDCVGG